jgi:hypothetical protein
VNLFYFTYLDMFSSIHFSGNKIILAFKNEFRIVPFFFILWNSLRHIDISSLTVL